MVAKEARKRMKKKKIRGGKIELRNFVERNCPVGFARSGVLSFRSSSKFRLHFRKLPSVKLLQLRKKRVRGEKVRERPLAGGIFLRN